MSKDDFLGRWSQRKLNVEQETADAQKTVVDEVAQPELLDEAQIPLREEGDADLIVNELGDELGDELAHEEQEPHPAEGIDIETLDYESDFTVFMNDKVPETLRRMALRKLWRSNPILANIDGLNDYDEDFTDAATVFINSAGDVISGTRDQFWDDDQLAEKKAKISEDDSENESIEEASDEGDEAQEETELADENDQGSEVADIEDADVEDIEDYDDLDGFELASGEKPASDEELKKPVPVEELEDANEGDVEKTEDNTDELKT